MAVSKRLRFEVFRRDNNTCRYCGRAAPDVSITIDHVIPEALGGTDEPSNLVTACKDCNSGKSATPPDAAVVAGIREDALEWSWAIQEAAGRMLDDLDVRLEYRAAFENAWLRWGTGTGSSRVTVALPPEWRVSVDNFFAAGLPIEVLVDCVDTTMAASKVRDPFRYTCGIAWNQVRVLQDGARTELDGIARAVAETHDAGTPTPLAQLTEAVEQLLLRLPSRLHHRAESSARRDCAGWEEGATDPRPRATVLADVLRHLGDALAAEGIAYAETEAS